MLRIEPGIHPWMIPIQWLCLKIRCFAPNADENQPLRKKLRLTLLTAMLLMGAVAGRSADEQTFNRGAIGIQVLLWNPTSLETNTGALLKPVAGSDYAPGLFIVSPSWNGIALRLQAFRWSLSDPQRQGLDDQITLHHFALEVKQQIISTSPISPYVIFGGTKVYSRCEENNKAAASNVSTNGIDVGTGIDALLLPHLSIAVEYLYLYVKFDEVIAATDDFSGSSFILRLAYTF